MCTSLYSLQECGLKLTEVSPKGALAMFETLRSVLHSGKISSRIQYMIEVLFAIRKDKFKVSQSAAAFISLYISFIAKSVIR